MKTFGQLKTKVRDQIWAGHEAENLVTQHDEMFQEALADIATWVDCEQVNNVNVIDFCKTNYKCGMTIVPAPLGVVRNVWVVCADQHCDPVFYRETDFPEPEVFGRNVLWALGQNSSSAKRLSLGFTEADAGNDCPWGRARTGIFAKKNGNIYIAPFIQSTEQIYVEWDGVKTIWVDNDPVNDTILYAKAVKLYVQYAQERDFGDPGRARMFRTGNINQPGLYDEALADLMHVCREQRKRRSETSQVTYRESTIIDPDFDQCIPPDVASGSSLIIAQIGAFADSGANAAAVAALVDTFGADQVLGIAPSPATSDYDLYVGKNYHQYISPYYGVYGDGAETNKFWPCPWGQDWGADPGLAHYLAFFSLPEPRRYYDMCFGLVHLFACDSMDEGDGEPDFLFEGEPQGEWLKARMAMSTARWKIVMMGTKAYNSWPPFLPLKAWGADLVLSGYPTYERVKVVGLQYINNGCGGKLLQPTNPGTPGQEHFDGTHYGAGKMTITKDSLLYEFIGTNGTVLDSVELTK